MQPVCSMNTLINSYCVVVLSMRVKKLDCVVCASHHPEFYYLHYKSTIFGAYDINGLLNHFKYSAKMIYH